MNVADIDGPNQGKLVWDETFVEDQTFEETTCKELEQPEGHFFQHLLKSSAILQSFSR
jgi:hypothetical protein